MEKVIEAVDAYRAQRGHNPERLQDLVPAYLPTLPQPRVLPGRCVYHLRRDSYSMILMRQATPEWNSAYCDNMRFYFGSRDWDRIP